MKRPASGRRGTGHATFTACKPPEVLVCWGTEDAWIPATKGAELAARIPGAQLRWLDGAGHLAQENAPAQLTAALADFLGSQAT